MSQDVRIVDSGIGWICFLLFIIAVSIPIKNTVEVEVKCPDCQKIEVKKFNRIGE